MKISSDQRGSSPVVLIVAIVAVAILGVVGYRVMTADQLDSAPSNSFSSTEPETLKTTADVKRADNSLDTVDMESPDQLNQDITEL